MTREADAIRSAFAASGLAGIVSDLDTPGVHASNSIHYAPGTLAAPVRLTYCHDYSKGNVGAAVDLAFVPAQRDSPGLLAIFNYFADHYGTQLAELIHSDAPFYIHNGTRYKISALDRSIFAAHHGHVHVGAHPGTFLAASTPTPAPTPEEQVQPVICVPCPTGGYWTVKTATGAVDAWSDKAGEAPYFWSLPGLKITPAAPIIGLAPLVQDRFVTGYWLYTAQGHIYAWGEAPYLRAMAEFPSWWSPGQEVIGLVQTGGQLSPDPIAYKQLTHQPSDNDDTIREYAFPLVA